MQRELIAREAETAARWLREMAVGRRAVTPEALRSLAEHADRAARVLRGERVRSRVGR